MNVLLIATAAFIWYCSGAASYLHWVLKWDGGGVMPIDRGIAVAMGLLGPLAYASCWFADVLLSSANDGGGPT